MRNFIMVMALLCANLVCAQEEKVQTFQIEKGEEIDLDFTYPRIVRINAWDKQEVKLITKVEINDGQDNDHFEIRNDYNNGRLKISSRLDNINKIKRRRFSSSKESEDDNVIHLGENNWNVEVNIVVEIYLPKTALTYVNAQYGLVEVISAPNELEIQAKFGGADLTIDASGVKQLRASTSWGQIYSDIASDNFKFTGSDMPGKRMFAELTSSRGVEINVKSDFGSIYLRKQ